MLDLTTPESRYDRQELISWWDQKKLAEARVLVVGAGALGNEIGKNFALLGVGALDFVDMDLIEHSNLARCVLFRDDDEGRPKAEVAAERAMAINPHVRARAWSNSVQELGVGFVREFDLIVGGLDNREARLWVGQACRKFGVTWVDGAIEGLQGLARVFPPTGACYECTLGEVDREILSHRQACALLTEDEMISGKVPTNSTTASVIAAIQTQEAVKILVDRADLVALNNRAILFNGDVLDTYRVIYEEDPHCLSHDRYVNVLEAGADDATAVGLAALVSRHLNGLPVEHVEFEDDIVLTGTCDSCGTPREIWRSRASLRRGDGQCACGGTLSLKAQRRFSCDDDLAGLSLGSLGLGLVDVLTFTAGRHRVHVVLDQRGGAA